MTVPLAHPQAHAAPSARHGDRLHPAEHAQDASFAFEAGNMAVELLKEGTGNQAIGVRHGRTFHMPLDQALEVKPVFKKHLYDLVNSL